MPTPIGEIRLLTLDWVASNSRLVEPQPRCVCARPARWNDFGRSRARVLISAGARGADNIAMGMRAKPAPRSGAVISSRNLSSKIMPSILRALAQAAAFTTGV